MVVHSEPALLSVMASSGWRSTWVSVSDMGVAGAVDTAVEGRGESPVATGSERLDRARGSAWMMDIKRVY
jgi:hypothetical protein